MSTKINVCENISIVTFTNVSSADYVCFSSNIFERAAAAGVNIDMITQSPGIKDNLSLAFTFQDTDMPKLLSIVNELSSESINSPMVNVGNVKIVVKSNDMVDGVGFAAKVFEALCKADCLPLLVTTAVDEISLLVHECFRSDLVLELERTLGS